MFDGKYLERNQNKIKGIIDHYGYRFMYFKKVLDLGCGHGDISGALQRLGADITAVDGRQEHLKMVNKKFPTIKVVKADLDRSWPFFGKKFDIVLSLDLMCYLKSYEDHLKNICDSATHLVLETSVIDSDDPDKVLSIQMSQNYDTSINGMGIRPSAAAIERVLSNNKMSFKRFDKTKFNAGGYVYDWEVKNTNQLDINKRRIWFAEKIHNISIQVPETIVTELTPATKVQSKLEQVFPVKSNKPKLKTALCISGHLRTFEENYNNLKTNLLNNFDCDVFIHTWSNVGHHARTSDAAVNSMDTANKISKLKSLFNIKDIVIEPFKEFELTDAMKNSNKDHRDHPGVASMFYKIEQCNKLKSSYEDNNNFKYDLVIRYRTDLLLQEAIVLNEVSANKLYLPNHGHFGGLNDQLAMGTSEVMDKYSSLYSNIDEYLESGTIFNPEWLLSYHINKLEIPVEKINWKYIIKRASGRDQDNKVLEKQLGFIK